MTTIDIVANLSKWIGTLLIGFGFGIIYADTSVWVYQRVFIAIGFFVWLFGAMLAGMLREEERRRSRR